MSNIQGRNFCGVREGLDKKGFTRGAYRKEKEEQVVYYCHEHEEEKWKIMEAVVDTSCEAIIVGEL